MKTLDVLIVSYATIGTFFLNEQFFLVIYNILLTTEMYALGKYSFCLNKFSVSSKFKLHDIPKVGVLC
jgi:hypothetical protein